jgi:hypothetical protein
MMMNKYNFFRRESTLFPFRWFIVIAIALAGLMAYADMTGWRLLSWGQEQWNAKGPGYHK